MLYVLSFGPACRIASRTGTGDAKFFAVAYWPMWWVMHRDVPIVDEILLLYAGMGMPSGGSLQIPSVGRLPDEDWVETTTISVE